MYKDNYNLNKYNNTDELPEDHPDYIKYSDETPQYYPLPQDNLINKPMPTENKVTPNPHNTVVETPFPKQDLGPMFPQDDSFSENNNNNYQAPPPQPEEYPSLEILQQNNHVPPSNQEPNITPDNNNNYCILQENQEQTQSQDNYNNNQNPPQNDENNNSPYNG